MLERLTVRISGNMNDWLDVKSEETGLSKSAIVSIALDNYRKEQTAMVLLPDVLKQLELLKELRVLGVQQSKE